MLVYEKVKPLIKRIPTVQDVSLKILRYDQDNLYPQRVEEIVRRSSTLKTILARIVDFVNGEGFVDQIVAKMVLNGQGLNGMSANKVLTRIAREFVYFDTRCGHVGYNGLGQIHALNPVPYHRLRLGCLDDEGRVNQIAYSANWEHDGRSGRDQHILFYPRFNPDPAVVMAEIEEAGGIENYRGQMIYDTPMANEYPLASCDAVLDDAQVQNEIGMFKLGNVQNSFLATLAVLFPGEFGSKQEETDFKDLIANKSGSRNAGTRIGLQDKSGQRKASDIFQPLTPPNIDKQYEFTERSVKENIMESEAFPQILMGKTQSGLLAQNDLQEAYIYVNSITRNRRLAMSEFFSEILRYWETPVLTDAAIIEQRYLMPGVTAAPAPTPAPAGPAAAPPAPTQPTA